MLSFKVCRLFPKKVQITNVSPISFKVPKYRGKNQKEIEARWKPCVSRSVGDVKLSSAQLNAKGKGASKYVLAMFPYPSGKLHMGHMRVYALADVFSKFYHMNGYSVIQPMGWDSFGLPAENAARERGEDPASWTWSNIKYMKHELNNLGFSFDWNREIATCHPSYYRWTQHIFLLLLRSGFAYQKEAYVNWDPKDETVLANEQVDANGLSWRSGAKVQKRKLKQWFINTTRLSEELYMDVDDPKLADWGDVPHHQNGWVGQPTGYTLEADLVDERGTTCSCISLWLPNLTSLRHIEFVGLHPDHELHDAVGYKVKEPLSGRLVPIVISKDFPFARGSNIYVESKPDEETTDQDILRQLQSQNVDVYRSSSHLRDWLISRQRYWGTPIPVVHCDKCGSVGVAEKDLPVELPEQRGSIVPLAHLHDWLQTQCPQCNGPARRETDTMDTFVDSSWYYLRYLDPSNTKEIVDKDIAETCLPVDLYIGGSGHSNRHLYYARFMHKFLAKEGVAFHKEPFRELLEVGLVKNTTYSVQSTGKYLHVDNVDTQAKPPVERATGQVVLVDTDKMSKSKYNGVEPQDVLDKWGIDATRLAILSQYGPECNLVWSHKDLKSSDAVLSKFLGMVRCFEEARRATPTPLSDDPKLARFLMVRRNVAISEVVENIEKSRQLNISIKGLKKLIDCLSSLPMKTFTHEEFEKTLKVLTLLFYPFCPHISAHAWHLVNGVCESDLGDIFQQAWPQVDSNFPGVLAITVNWEKIASMRLEKPIYDALTLQKATDYAHHSSKVQKVLEGLDISDVDFHRYGHHYSSLNIFTRSEKNESDKVPVNK